MNENQQAVFANKKFTMVMHLNTTDGGIIQHRCEDLKLTRSIFTPKVKGVWGKGVATYFLDGDDTEYDSLAGVADAILKRNATVS